MLRSILAVLVGYLAISILVMLLFMLLSTLSPDLFATPGVLPPILAVTLILAYSFVAAIVGGFVTATIAQRSEAKHVWVLMGFMLVMGVVSIRQYSSQPLWYSLVLLLLGPLGAYLGGKVGIARKRAPDIE